MPLQARLPTPGNLSWMICGKTSVRLLRVLGVKLRDPSPNPGRVGMTKATSRSLALLGMTIRSEG
jgi:hypothetical protein